MKISFPGCRMHFSSASLACPNAFWGFAPLSTLHGSRFLSHCHETKYSLLLPEKSSRSICQCMGSNPFPKIYLHFFAGSLWSDDILSKETHCPRLIHSLSYICNVIIVSLTGAVGRENLIPCRRPVMQSTRCACLVQSAFPFQTRPCKSTLAAAFCGRAAP